MARVTGLRRLGRFTARHPARLLAIVALLVAGAGLVGSSAFDALDPHEFKDPGTESARGIEAVEHVTDVRGDGTVLALVETPFGPTLHRERIAQVVAQLARVEGIKSAIGPLKPRNPMLMAQDARSVLVVGAVDADADSKDVAPAVEAAFEDQPDVRIGGVVVAEHQGSEQSEEDLRRAESLAFPVLLALSLLFFRSLVAALLPLVLGAVAILMSLATMRLLHEVVPLSVLAINVVTALGLGLAIDYSLFVLSRYREELARGATAEDALATTLGTAGRAVAFSGVTVACAMASLLVFPQQFLYSVAISGIAVTLLCAVAALLVLPAVLRLLGRRIDSLAPRWLQRSQRSTALPSSQGRWYRFAHWVMRHPGVSAVAAATALIALTVPAFGARFVPDDVSMLPESRSAGAVDREIRRSFSPDPQYPIIVQWVTDAPAGTPPPDWVVRYRKEAEALPGVAAVGPPTRVGPGIVRMEVFSGVGRATPAARRLVEAVRDLDEPADARVRVGGLAASQIDEERSVLRKLPLAVTILLTTTFTALFVMTGSLLLPLKALLMNALTLGASVGLMVLVFQHGNLEGLLEFESAGGISVAVSVVVAVGGFGLSTDYGVFSLNRIRELRDRGVPNHEAVALGLERTGRLITSAALLFAVAMGALVTSTIVGIKQSGLGLPAAVLIDATIVRALLVPSLMALLGERNWWAPRPLRRFALEPEG